MQLEFARPVAEEEMVAKSENPETRRGSPLSLISECMGENI